MHALATMAMGPAPGLGDLGAHLPWAWFALLAAADAVLIGVVVHRKRVGHRPARVTSPAVPSPRIETLVMRNGWRVPRSRVLGLRAQPAAYAWPLHSEYMVSRLG